MLARPAPMLSTEVVLPTPPFWLTTAMTLAFFDADLSGDASLLMAYQFLLNHGLSDDFSFAVLNNLGTKFICAFTRATIKKLRSQSVQLNAIARTLYPTAPLPTLVIVIL